MHSWRQSPGSGSAMWRMWNSMSKFLSSTHHGWSALSGTVTIRRRKASARWSRASMWAMRPLKVTLPPGAVDGS